MKTVQYFENDLKQIKPKAIENHELEKYGAKQITKELPCLFYSTEVQNLDYVRCNPKKLGHDSQQYTKYPSYNRKERLRFNMNFPDECLDEFSVTELDLFNFVRAIDIGINPKFDSKEYRYTIDSEDVIPGSMPLRKRCFRAPYDTPQMMFEELSDKFEHPLFFVARGMFYQGLDEKGKDYRAAIVDTQEDTKSLIRHTRPMLDILMRTKRQYNLNFFGLLSRKEAEPTWRGYSMGYDIWNVSPYTTMILEDARNFKSVSLLELK